jgi:ERF superfamily
MNDPQLPLATREQKPLANQSASVGAMLQTVIEKGVTSENVAALEQLVGLYERLEAKDAEKAFNAAFVALQTDTPVIVAKTVIPNRGKYEKFEDVMQVVGPLLIRNGFAVSFEQLADDKRIKVTCHLRHIGGHSQSTSFAVRLGGKADSDTQADCKASTTAKRNALLQALNIVIRQDCLQDEDDPHNEGQFISPDNAEMLRVWVESTRSDRTKFLEHAQAETFDKILNSRFEDLCDTLRRREEKNNRGQ